MIAQQQDSGYEIKNKLLTLPADWMVNADTLELAKKSLPLLEEFDSSEGQKTPQKTPLHGVLKEELNNVFTIPFLSDVYCKILMDEIRNMQSYGLFEPNPDEDELRQIPEVYLPEHAQEIEDALMQVVHAMGNPIYNALWNRSVNGGGIQIANYNITQKKQGAWHHDYSADITMVIPLNTGEYEGGGTEFIDGKVSPQENGTAVIFPSFTHLHRGLPIKSGDRYLLVFWLTFTEEDDNEQNG